MTGNSAEHPRRIMATRSTARGPGGGTRPGPSGASPRSGDDGGSGRHGEDLHQYICSTPFAGAERQRRSIAPLDRARGAQRADHDGRYGTVVVNGAPHPIGEEMEMKRESWAFMTASPPFRPPSTTRGSAADQAQRRGRGNLRRAKKGSPRTRAIAEARTTVDALKTNLQQTANDLTLWRNGKTPRAADVLSSAAGRPATPPPTTPSTPPPPTTPTTPPGSPTPTPGPMPHSDDEVH